MTLTESTLTQKCMKVVMAPVNIAGQPITLVKALRRQGVDIHLLQYTTRKKNHQFAYEMDQSVNYNSFTRSRVQMQALENLIVNQCDIFHFWLRSLFFGGVYSNFTGLDIPIIKSFGKKIVYRFTGEDLRLKSVHMQKNPHHAYQYGYQTMIDEAKQRKYIDYISQYVDEFIVGDPELHEFFPSAKIVPRVIDLDQWQFVGPCHRDCPVVIHAPSSPQVKGTKWVRRAVAALKQEGLRFQYFEINNMPHHAAKLLYQHADIIIDQLHIGWYGVLSVEAMALGKTVLTYIREDLMEKHAPNIPLVNVNPFTLQQQLRTTIKDYELRTELGKKARLYVVETHDVIKIAKQFINIYTQVQTKNITPTNITPIINYLDLQLSEFNQLPILLGIIRGTLMNRLKTVLRKILNYINPYAQLRRYKVKQFCRKLF